MDTFGRMRCRRYSNAEGPRLEGRNGMNIGNRQEVVELDVPPHLPALR